MFDTVNYFQEIYGGKYDSLRYPLVDTEAGRKEYRCRSWKSKVMDKKLIANK